MRTFTVLSLLLVAALERTAWAFSTQRRGPTQNRLRAGFGTGSGEVNATSSVKQHLSFSHAGAVGEAPCGPGTPDPSFSIYQDTLLAGVCALPLSHTDSQFMCRDALGCLLTDFHAGGCGGIKNYPGDVCAVCTSEVSMRNSSVGGHEYVNINGTYFYEYRDYFQETYSAHPDYMEVIQDGVRGKQLTCAAMIMVKDRCAAARTPSCNSFDVEAIRRIYNKAI